METRHVRFDFNEALTAKKQILTFELDILRMLKRVKAYRLLRKKELQKVNRLKTNITSFKSKINTFISTFPKEEIPRIERKHERKERPKKIKRERGVSSKLQRELEEIKSKLADLNKLY